MTCAWDRKQGPPRYLASFQPSLPATLHILAPFPTSPVFSSCSDTWECDSLSQSYPSHRVGDSEPTCSGEHSTLLTEERHQQRKYWVSPYPGPSWSLGEPRGLMVTLPPWVQMSFSKGLMVVKLSVWPSEHRQSPNTPGQWPTQETLVHRIQIPIWFYSNTGRNNDLQSWVETIS